MLEIVIPSIELFDNVKNEFIIFKETRLLLEHSLLSVSKWESKWCTPFLSDKPKTIEETIDYIRCMTLTQNVNNESYKYITNENIEQVNGYINSKMTATILPKQKESTKRDVVTSEIIYYWMISLNIPFECQKWHFNRLLTLIGVCNVKTNPKTKMSKKEIIERNRRINAERKKQIGTKG